MYMISLLDLPISIKGKARLLLMGMDKRRRYHNAKWSVLYRTKDHGGLGIFDLGIRNTALLCKWLFELLCSDGTRQ
ncbi:hypothetical protein U9M48_004393 [Paspalum notatum var. saurae]|uniref:Uncharacterized protein n=1 Tax=Paspalum notatum var. saurae TaxID=547442 RepID=A0AAQ3SES8_PASNO